MFLLDTKQSSCLRFGPEFGCSVGDPSIFAPVEGSGAMAVLATALLWAMTWGPSGMAAGLNGSRQHCGLGGTPAGRCWLVKKQPRLRRDL
jgi:hypothetical protein